MFRQEEVLFGGWQERTIESMQRRRYDQWVRRLPPLGSDRLDQLEPTALSRRLELCWQDIERKPMRAQQMAHVWQRVLSSIELQADCLSHEEHELVERALVLGGCARLEDAQEIEAAQALSFRMWASVGLASGRPYMELEKPVLQPAAKAFAREEHEQIRRKLGHFSAALSATLYRCGVIDDRQPQRMLLQDVFAGKEIDENHVQLARRFLWAEYDCVDYSDGVMLVHPALAEPRQLIALKMRRSSARWLTAEDMQTIDILPEEIPLQHHLERVIAGVLREGLLAQDVARSIRFLCKQGAPLHAMEELLQESLMVYVSPFMRGALENMFIRMPKWTECAEHSILQ